MTLRKIRSVRIVNNSSLEANKRAWTPLSDGARELLENSANAAVAAILELEPLASENDGHELLLEFQKIARA